jgi:hypothetical protein
MDQVSKLRNSAILAGLAAVALAAVAWRRLPAVHPAPARTLLNWKHSGAPASPVATASFAFGDLGALDNDTPETSAIPSPVPATTPAIDAERVKLERQPERCCHRPQSASRSSHPARSSATPISSRAENFHWASPSAQSSDVFFAELRRRPSLQARPQP